LQQGIITFIEYLKRFFRWGHVEIARYLIENVQGWTKDDLINAGGVTQNSEIKKMIKSKLSLKRKGFGKMFICG
jgi:hypothetical protein